MCESKSLILAKAETKPHKPGLDTGVSWVQQQQHIHCRRVLLFLVSVLIFHPKFMGTKAAVLRWPVVVTLIK